MARARRVNSAQVTETNKESDVSVQEEMFKSLLKTPHGRADETLDLHRRQFDRDPNFYAKLACHAVLRGGCVVRDINEIFISTLFASPYPEHRSAAFVMLQSLPPFQVERVMDYYTGANEIVNYPSCFPALPPSGTYGLKYKRAKHSKNHSKVELRGKDMPTQTITVSKDLAQRWKVPVKSKVVLTPYLFDHAYHNKKSVNGALKEAVSSYLRLREATPSHMEGALLRSKNSIRKMYARTHTKPAEWVDAYVFKGEAQPGSRLAALNTLRTLTDPLEQSRLIIEHKIPFVHVSKVMGAVTPALLIALVESMSPQELLSQLGALKRRGAFDNPDIKKLIDSKLKKAKSSKASIDALKGSIAVNAIDDLDEDIAKTVIDVSNTQIKRHGQIRARTVLAIDKSGSMEKAIEIAKVLGAALAQACVAGNPPITFVFDVMATPIVWTARDGDITTKSAWDNKLKMVRANGGTVPSMVVKALSLSKTIFDQIVLITDEEENNVGSFAEELKKYADSIGNTPNVVIVRVGDHNYDYMQKSLEKKNIPVDVLQCNKIDSVSVPNLIQLLSRPSVFDFVQEVLNIELPSKQDWLRQNSF